MTLPDRYPQANQTAQPRPKLAGGGRFDHVEKLCLHTTETAGWPGYPTFAPHLTYDPWNHVFHQHYGLTYSATTLVDGEATNVRENRDFVIQVEIVAYCDPAMVKKHGHGINDIDDQAVRDLAELAAWLTRYGLELRLADGWLPYPASYGNSKNRMTGPEYDDFRGVLGHEHVSTNLHGDPGAPPWLPTFLAYARAAAGQTQSTPDTTPPTGKGLDMAAAKDVYVKYNAKQALKAGENEIVLNAEQSKTLVIGPSDGVDVAATIEVVDPTGARAAVRSFFRVVSYKDKTPTTKVSDRLATYSDQVTFKGDISKLDDGRSPRLRLVIDAGDRTDLTLNWLQVTGWKL